MCGVGPVLGGGLFPSFLSGYKLCACMQTKPKLSLAFSQKVNKSPLARPAQLRGSRRGAQNNLIPMDDSNYLRLLSVVFTLLLLSLSNGTGSSATQSCPIEIQPERMLIEYQGKSQNANCTPTSEGSANQGGAVFWQVQQGIKTNSRSWSADTNKDWDARPVCVGTFKGIGTCQKHLDFTLYKTPDSVSIRHAGNSSTVVENSEFQLQCDIINIAPAQNLTVLWYRGNETIKSDTSGSLQVTNCTDSCDINVIRSPLNVSSTINITLERQHSGAEFRCMAKLDFEPQRQLESSPLNITVHYKPSINTTKLPKTIPVFRGYPEVLICEADGYPPPEIKWLYNSDSGQPVSGNMLTVSEAGFYRCRAANDVDSITHEVQVILKEDYLPLIAGFVAVTVVAISIIFLFIYSIYYKNTRMRRYSLKNPKLSTHNGNVAHNGLDLQFPMTKLS